MAPRFLLGPLFSPQFFLNFPLKFVWLTFIIPPTFFLALQWPPLSPLVPANQLTSSRKKSNATRSIKDQKVFYSAMRGYPSHMERVFQKSFDPSHYHTIRHTGVSKVLLLVKTLKAGKAAGCNEIRPEIHKALNRGVFWLTRVC